MTRSIQELLDAADQVIESLLGTEVTEADIATALERHCSDWSEQDQNAVITLTAGVAYRIADIGFEYCGGEPGQIAYPLHYLYVAEELLAREGLRPRVVDPEARRTSMIDRHLEHPLPGYPQKWPPSGE